MVKDLKSHEGIFALFKDMLSREFTKITKSNENLVEVITLEALTKLCLCDVPIQKLSMNINDIFISYRKHTRDKEKYLFHQVAQWVG